MKSRLTFSRIASAIKTIPASLALYVFPGTSLKGLRLRCLKFAGAEPKQIKDWSLRTMREKLVKIGAKVVSHSRYVTFQMAEVLVSRSLFYEILERIKRLKPVPIGYD